MRTAVVAYSGIIITILMVAIISVVTMKSSYYEVISESLDDSILYSVKMLQDGRYLTVDTDAVVYDGNDMHQYNGVDLFGDSAVNFTTVRDEKLLREYNNQKLKAGFVDYLTSSLDARIDSVDIDIYGADAEYGLLSARITAHFRYPGIQNGDYEKGSVTVYKTAILNKTKKQK